MQADSSKVPDLRDCPTSVMDKGKTTSLLLKKVSQQCHVRCNASPDSCTCAQSVNQQRLSFHEFRVYGFWLG